MPDIVSIRGDTRVVNTPVFDADLDRFRTETEVGSANAIEYKISDSSEDETTYIEKDFDDAEVFVTTPSEIESIEFDDLEDETPDAGIVRVKLFPSDTESLPADTLWHELQITDSDGNVSTVMQGEFEVLESSTNP